MPPLSVPLVEAMEGRRGEGRASAIKRVEEPKSENLIIHLYNYILSKRILEFVGCVDVWICKGV